MNFAQHRRNASFAMWSVSVWPGKDIGFRLVPDPMVAGGLDAEAVVVGEGAAKRAA